MTITKLSRLFIVFCTLTVFVRSAKNHTFIHPSVAKYHVEFLNGDKDSVLRFQQQHHDLIEDKYVYIAYLHKYCKHKKYVELLKAHK